MEILELKAKNLFCFGEMELDFRACGKLTLIEGSNLDASIAKSNGSGKTSTYEALLWTYTGQTKKGLTGDAVINERAAKGAECWGRSQFTQGGGLYQITRSRNQSPHLKLEVSDNAGGWNDETKGTDKETQALLESIIKMSPLTFSKMTYFGQEDVKTFAGLGDKDLKAIFEQALGIEFIRDDYEKVRQHGSKVELEATEVRDEISDKQAETDQLNEKINYLSDADAELKRQHAAQVDTIKAEIDSLKDEAKPHTAKVTAADGSIKEPAVKHIEDKLVTLGESLKALRVKIKDNDAVFYKLDSEVGRLEKEIAGHRVKVKKVTDIVGTPCGTCSKIYEPSDIEAAKEGIKKQWIEAGVNLKAGRLERDKNREQSKKLAELEEKLTATIDNLKDQITKERASFDRAAAEVTQAKTELDRLNKGIKAKENTLAGLLAQTVGYEAEIKDANGKIEVLTAAIFKLADQLAIIEDKLVVVGMLKTILGDAGLKNYVFNSVTPELNRLSNEYLQMLENINVEISTVKQLKSGEFRDKFSISVINHSGSGNYKSNSGGERQKIDFAISLAFNSVIRAMSEESVNLIFLDEPFESLDEDSAESAVELIGKVIGGNKAFLIAHKSHIKHLTHETLTVQKKGGFSTINHTTNETDRHSTIKKMREAA